MRSSQLDEVIELVRRTPDVQFVLDHVGKPRIGADPSRWRLQIAELAARRNIVCKLSGLMTEIVSGPTGVEAVEPFLAHALAEFGPDRCLFGTDWPVMTTAATYSEWLDLVTRLVPGEDERRAVMAGTAERVYRAFASRRRRGHDHLVSPFGEQQGGRPVDQLVDLHGATADRSRHRTRRPDQLGRRTGNPVMPVVQRGLANPVDHRNQMLGCLQPAHPGIVRWFGDGLRHWLGRRDDAAELGHPAAE